MAPHQWFNFYDFWADEIAASGDAACCGRGSPRLAVFPELELLDLPPVDLVGPVGEASVREAPTTRPAKGLTPPPS
jgi:hypothetical protein